MKVLFWNTRGVGNLETRLVLKKLIVSHKPDFIFISEPWIRPDQFPARFWEKLHLKVFAVNSRNHLNPNLWCACSTALNPNFIACSSQFVAFSIDLNNQSIFFSAVYASVTYAARRHLWNDLTSLQQNVSGPWCYIGDFNVVLGAHEQKRKGLPLRIASDEHGHTKPKT